MNTMQAEWKEYTQKVLAPCDIGSIQYDETRKAFYAGAWSLFSIFNKVSEDNITDEAGEAILDGLQQELLDFIDEMKALIGSGERGSKP